MPSSSADNAGPPPPRPRGGAVSVAVALPSDWTLNERQMCDLEMILSGAFAPLEGFMTLADYQSVLDSMTLANGEIFPLPVVLSIPKSCCGETAATNVYWMSTATSIINNQGKMMLRDAVGTVIAQLDVESVYLPDIEEEMDKVLGTRDTNHPYVRYLLENHKESYYVGGRIKEINKIIHYNYINYRLSPIACKEKIKEKKNNKIVIGFQTRNPIHRSHYELIKHALYIVANKEKKQPILLLSPVIGPTQPGDIPYYIRTRCYEHVLRYFIQDKQCIFNHLDNTATSTPNRSPPRYQPGEEEEEQEGEEEQQQQQHQQQQQQEKQEEQENIIREEIIKREGIEEKKEEEKEGKEGEGKGGKAGGEEGGGEEEEEEEGGINNNKNYNAMLVLIPLAMRMAGPRECILHALIRKNYGCTHFIVGRDHAGPSTTKQDGTPFYGPYDAHKLLGLYADKLGIIPIFGEEMLYIGEENKGYYIQERYIKEIKKNKPNILINKLSGTQLRYKLINRLFIPSWFSFPDVIHELKSFYKQNHQRGLCVYFTGLPCSGKSTLANALEARILENNKERRRITLLDADVVRQHLSKGLGFNKEDRSTNVRRIGYIASEITKHGGICIVANIAPYNTDRLFNRKLIEQEGGVYVEVYVCTPLSVCEERDIKDLYKKARKGIIKQFTGVSDPYEVPTHPELTIDSSTNIKDKVTRIHQYLIDQGYVLPPSSSSSYSSSCSPTDKE